MKASQILKLVARHSRCRRSVPSAHRTSEDFFDLGYLDHAGQKGLKSFGKDIFSAPGAPEHQ